METRALAATASMLVRSTPSRTNSSRAANRMAARFAAEPSRTSFFCAISIWAVFFCAVFCAVLIWAVFRTVVITGTLSHQYYTEQFTQLHCTV